MPDKSLHGDGGSAVNRHREIDAFFELLSPWDLIYLRSKLRQVNLQEVGSKQFAQCTDLPPEILAIISGHLSLKDLQSLRCVSRGWRIRWMRHAVLIPLMRNHFPGMMELHRPDEGSIERLLLEAAARHQAQLRATSQFSILFVPWISADARIPTDGQTKLWFDQSLVDQDCSPWADKHNPPQHLYNDGQVVWKSDVGRFFLDDLRTGYRIHIRAEVDLRRGRRMEKLVAFSKQLIVLDVSGYDGSGRHYLAVYHIEERRWKECAIPSPIDQCSAHGFTVIIGCLSGEILTWEWDGKLQYLPPDEFFIKEAPPSGFQRDGGFYGALFHPQYFDYFWLVWVHLRVQKGRPVLEGDSLFTTHVIRYSRQSEGWKASNHFEQSPTSSRNHETALRVLSPDHPPVCEKASEYGTYTIVTFQKVRDIFQRDGVYWHIGHMQCFNVVTETFDIIDYPVHMLRRSYETPPPYGLASPDRTGQVRLWDGVIYPTGRLVKTTHAGFSVHRIDKWDNKDSDRWFDHKDIELRPPYLTNNETALSVDKYFILISGKEGYVVCPLAGKLPAKLQSTAESVRAYMGFDYNHCT